MTSECPFCDAALSGQRECDEHGTIPTKGQAYAVGLPLYAILTIMMLVIFPPAGLVAAMAGPFAVMYFAREYTA